MKKVNVAIIQIILIILAITINGVLQTIALVKLNQLPKDSSVAGNSRKLLLISLLAHFIGIAVAILTAILISKLASGKQTETLLNIGLVLCTTLLFIGGAIGARVASTMQCSRDTNIVHDAWYLSSLSAVIGIVGTVLVLIVQILVRKEQVKQYILRSLQDQPPKVQPKLMVVPIPQKPSAPPAYKVSQMTYGGVKGAVPMYHPSI